MEKTQGKRYPAICPKCSREIYVCKSLGQKIGYFDLGAGECPYCGTFLHFTFIPESDTMAAEPYEDFAER